MLSVSSYPPVSPRIKVFRGRAHFIDASMLNRANSVGPNLNYNITTRERIIHITIIKG